MWWAWKVHSSGRELSGSSTLLELGGSTPSPFSMSNEQDGRDVIKEWLEDPNNLTLEDYQNNLVGGSRNEGRAMTGPLPLPPIPRVPSTPLAEEMVMMRAIGDPSHKRNKVLITRTVIALPRGMPGWNV